MPWWTWVSLHALSRRDRRHGGRRHRALASHLPAPPSRTQKGLLVALEDLARDAEAVERRFEQASERAAELEARLASLQRSAEKLGVLKWAMSDSIDAVNRLRHAVPRK